MTDSVISKYLQRVGNLFANEDESVEGDTVLTKPRLPRKRVPGLDDPVKLIPTRRQPTQEELDMGRDAAKPKSVWTKTPPTEEGWYWIWEHNSNQGPEVAEVVWLANPGNRLVYFSQTSSAMNLSCAWRWGPRIKLPEEKPE